MRNGKEKMITILINLPISMLVRGFVLMKLWNWFLIDSLNFSELGIITAIGINLIIGIIVLGLNFNDDYKTVSFEKFFSTIFNYSIVTPLLVLLVGYIVQLFI